MIQMHAAEADGNLLELLQCVENGESVVITRHGKPIAHLTPDEEHLRALRKETMEELMQRRSHWNLAPMTIQEILDLRHEGHRF